MYVVVWLTCICPWQALSVVLNINHFPFVIEVACWATKREFLKLEKWITDKIKEHHVSSELNSDPSLHPCFLPSFQLSCPSLPPLYHLPSLYSPHASPSPISQELFISECVQFLMARAPKPVAPVAAGSERTGVTHEIILTILACLQPFMG